MVFTQRSNCIGRLQVAKCVSLFVTVWAKTSLVCTYQYFKKYYTVFWELNLKTSFALVLDSFTEHNITVFSYLLAFLQLTWQVDNGWFLPVFDDFFMEFINVGPMYTRG